MTHKLTHISMADYCSTMKLSVTVQDTHSDRL